MSLIISSDTDAKEALSLPPGRFALQTFFNTPTPDSVRECVDLIVKEGGCDLSFRSQSEIIVYAGNNLGWGNGRGYSLA